MKKMLPWLITILLAITLIAVVAIVLFNNILGGGSNDPAKQAEESVQNVEAEKITADELVAVTSELKGIKTNLSDPTYIVQIDFAFQLDTAETKAEFELIKEFAIKPIIISTLGDINPEEVSGSQGKDALQSKLLNLINEKLTESSEGKLVNVTITNILVAQI